MSFGSMPRSGPWGPQTPPCTPNVGIRRDSSFLHPQAPDKTLVHGYPAKRPLQHKIHDHSVIG